MGAIDHHPQALEAHLPWQRPLGELDIALQRPIDALGAPEILRFGKAGAQIGVDQRFDLALHRVRQLEAVGPEQLMPLSSKGLWDAEIITRNRPGGERVSIATPGVGHRAKKEHVDAYGQKARRQRVLDHVAGQPRVLADDDLLAVAIAIMQADGHADAHRNIRVSSDSRSPGREYRLVPK
jgi:hypothetical protein